MSFVGVILLGFILGVRHALEADHVAAVASLSTRSRSWSEGLKLGVAWGSGHALMLLLVGSVVLLVDRVVPERIAAALELGVGVMLVGLGLDVLRRLAVERRSKRAQLFSESHPWRLARRFPGRALVVGLMHGMAGSAALVLLTLTHAPSVVTGFLYIAVFGVGSILGMALLSLALSVPFRLSEMGDSWLRQGAHAFVGAVTIAVGLGLIYQTAWML